ncbi:MAG: hypothetical protein ACP6IY_06400 [Promethearchaeia archaeon]
MIIYPDSNEKNSIRCAICNDIIREFSKIYQPNPYFGIICEECLDKFGEKDAEIIAQMFAAFGGYFGQKASNCSSFEKIITELINEIETQKEKYDLRELKVKIIHQALLYGIPPKTLSKIFKFIKKK